MLLDTPDVEIGWQAHPFDLADPDGNHHTLNELMGSKGLLIAFICNHCPYVKAIAERFAADAKALQAEGINVAAINPNDYKAVPADSPPLMKKFAAQHGFRFPYLVDGDQARVTSFAQRT